MSKKIIFFNSKYKWYFPLLIIVMIGIGIFSSIIVYNKTLEKNKLLLLERTKTISAFLDSKDFSTLSADPSDETKEQYISIKKHLQKAIKESKDTRFMYVMVKKESGMYFLADSEDKDSPDYSAPGDIFADESIAIDNAFNNKLGSVEGPTKDSWGTWFSGITPILSENGDVSAIFGIDVASEHYIADAKLIATIPILVTLFVVLVLMIGVYIQKKEEEVLELRSRFVAMASHEIRSPLTGLSWAIQSLEKENMTDSAKQILQKAHLNVANLIETINDILGITELQSSSKVKKEKIFIKPIIQNVIKDLELTTMKRRMEIKFENEIPENCEIKAEEEKIKRVFANILSNAIKYSKDGSIVTVNFKEVDNNNVITIKDEGVGVPKEEISKVLSGFYRASNVKADYNGSGLGLYYAKQIMESYKGKIELNSEEGGGTLVSISFLK